MLHRLIHPFTLSVIAVTLPSPTSFVAAQATVSARAPDEHPTVGVDKRPRPAGRVSSTPGDAGVSPAATSPRVEVSGAPGQGLTVRVGEAYSLNVRSRIQLRYQINVAAEAGQGERDVQQLVNIGTARLWFSGHVFSPALTYMLQLAVAGRDFRDGATSPIYDAYLDWKIHRDFNLRAGQFFVPFDRLRTVREWALQLAERPRPVQEFTLDRDVGIAVYSERFLGASSPLAWRIGAFGGGGTNLTRGRDPGALLVGRLELRPLGPIDDDKEGDQQRRQLAGMAVGGGFAANLKTNRLRSTTGATFQGGTTDSLHAALDLVFKWYGLALQAEYLWKRVTEDALVFTAADLTPLVEYTRSGQGWIVQLSYTFDPPFEVVGRLSRIYAADGTDPRLVTEVEQRGQEVAGGLNYYFNDHRMKLQADWIGLMPGNFDLQRAQHVAHLQFDVTF